MDTRREGQRLAYRPDLDGLRAVAILLVILNHTGLPIHSAAAGVTAFFVLSGYLITSILIADDRVDLRSFYRRRIRRLAPAFFVMLGIVGVLGVAGAWGGHWRPDRFVASLFYVTNWAVVEGPPFGPTDHAWSLAIEEQFYLSWPLLVAFLSRRTLIAVASIAAIGALVIRSLSPEAFGYFATPARMDGLLLGSILALARVRLSGRIGMIGLALLGIAAFGIERVADVTTIATVAAALIVSAPTPLGALAPLGKRAYSLYLWNSPMVLLFGAIGTSLTFVVGELSYRLIERPFLAPARQAHPEAPPVEPAGAGPAPLPQHMVSRPA